MTADSEHYSTVHTFQHSLLVQLDRTEWKWIAIREEKERERKRVDSTLLVTFYQAASVLHFFVFSSFTPVPTVRQLFCKEKRTVVCWIKQAKWRYEREWSWPVWLRLRLPSSKGNRCCFISRSCCLLLAGFLSPSLSPSLSLVSLFYRFRATSSTTVTID